MGYFKRITQKKVDCRPKEYKNDKFPKNSIVCNKKCIYFRDCKKWQRDFVIYAELKKPRAEATIVKPA